MFTEVGYDHNKKLDPDPRWRMDTRGLIPT
jgi:hypothetical protein